ncbi:site-specific integrase [Nocardia sp. NPDC050793]|uniref:tyrosine-type recombinase/integrase n=1 Tax=Nocardia sp. NPDC050793 TaxID=3155159 RepID=UPI0033F0E799
MFDEIARDVRTIQVPKRGRVVEVSGPVPFVVVDETGALVAPIRRFLVDFVAQGNSPNSVRSYAFALLRWWRWLCAVDVEWDQATAAETRDLVLWLGFHSKPRTSPRTRSLATAGTVNPLTRKRYLDDRYAARTIRHSNAVVRSFYEFWIEVGEGPLINPVPLARGGGRANAHHNPLEPYRPGGRIRYNPKLPKRQPREIPDPQWQALFAALRSNRDRAVLALAVSTAARAQEILGLRVADVDWGEQLVQVIRKGTQSSQWLPASAEAFVWLRLYLAEFGEPLDPNQHLWRTLRRRDRGEGPHHQPMSYDALRKVLTRANAALGTNWSMHDARHTCALRMVRDENLDARDVQIILGHAHLSTTADIYLVEDQAQIVRRVQHHLADRRATPPPLPPAGIQGYDDSDLTILFGGQL